MASVLHEAILLLVEESPKLAAELLTVALHVKLPAYTKIELRSFDFSDIKPAEYRADRVVLFHNAEGECVFATVLEAQLSPDADKWLSWPVYATTVRAKYKCPVVVWVVAPTLEMERWCSRSVDVGYGFQFTPLVLGPSLIPVVKDPQVAEAMPELCVLSAIAHGKGPEGEAIGCAFASIAKGLDEERRVF